MTQRTLTDYFDRDGQPITISCWALLQNDPHYRVLRKDRLPCEHGQFPLTVSTVWTGLDLAKGEQPKPMIYETLVMGGLKDRYCRTYATAEEALEGHDEILEQVKALKDRMCHG